MSQNFHVKINTTINIMLFSILRMRTYITKMYRDET